MGDREMKIELGALAVLVLLTALVPNIIATTTQGYWTASNAPAPPRMKKYHIFLDGMSPSSRDRPTKLGNDGLRTCLNFGSNSDNLVVCHPMGAEYCLRIYKYNPDMQQPMDIPMLNDLIDVISGRHITRCFSFII